MSALNKEILNFLNTINDTSTVNKLLVSGFLIDKKIFSIKNYMIKDLVIKLEDNLYNKLQIF